MNNETITLLYNKLKKSVTIPKNYLELKNIFIKEFNEDKNKKFSFSFLSKIINEKTDFKLLIEKNPKNIQIYITVQEIKENQNNQNINSENIKEIPNRNTIKNTLYDEVNDVSEQNSINESQNNNLKENINNNNIFKTNPNEIKIKKDIDIFSLLEPNYNSDKFYYCLEYKFIIFLSIDNILNLICSNGGSSIICYNLVDNKKIIEIKNKYYYQIINFRHYLDKKNYRDLVLLMFSQFVIELFNVNNWELILKIDNYIDELSCSACFLNNNDKIYIISSSGTWSRPGDDSNFNENIRVYDIEGSKLKETKTNNITHFIDSYYENKNSKSYIITGNEGYIMSYEYNSLKKYFKYSDSKKYNYLFSTIINSKKEETQLIEPSIDGYIRIWNFHTGKLLYKIQVCRKNGLGSINLWNDNYLFAATRDKTIKLIDLKNGKIINELTGHNRGVSLIKKVVHPIYGECLISKEAPNKRSNIFGLIKLWSI